MRKEAAPRIFQLSSGPNRFQCEHEKRSKHEILNLPVARTTFSVNTKILVPTRFFQPSSGPHHCQCRHEKTRPNKNLSTFQCPEPLSVSTRKKSPQHEFAPFSCPYHVRTPYSTYFAPSSFDAEPREMTSERSLKPPKRRTVSTVERRKL